MMITRFYRKQWRLLALVALSALLHLAAITLIRHRPAALPAGEAMAPLTVSLKAGSEVQGKAVPKPAVPPQARAPQEKNAAALPTPRPPDALLPGQPPRAIQAGDAPQQMPGRYRVNPPPSLSLEYQVSQAGPGQLGRATDAAQLSWRNGDDGAYALRLSTGFFGPSLDSNGSIDDDGIAPMMANELRGGSQLQTRFDRGTGRIHFGANGKDAPIATGSQDRLSLLMQLAGIGLAEPAQVQGTLEFYVAGPDGAGVVRLDVLGEEVLAGPMGKTATWHLAEPAAPGAGRLEVWLAPKHSWLPVKVRTTQAGGATTTMTATAITLK
jgi:hypothetical protein